MGTQTNTSLVKRRTTVRRAVIGGLVAICLVLFTAYFREPGGGVLHGVQDGAGSVMAPVQEVAAGAIEPFQDAWSWTTGLIDARDKAAAFEDENAVLRAALVANVSQAERVTDLEALLGIQGDIPTGYRAVNASVIGRSTASGFYARVRLDVGTADGVIVNSPVVASSDRGAALVGVVIRANANDAVISFITDPITEIGATVQNSGGAPGILKATVDGQLELTKVPRSFRVVPQAVVETAGFNELNLPSIYPRGIPIGQVAGVGGQEVEVYQSIQVTPFADVRALRVVTVLAPVTPGAKRRASGP